MLRRIVLTGSVERECDAASAACSMDDMSAAARPLPATSAIATTNEPSSHGTTSVVVAADLARRMLIAMHAARRQRELERRNVALDLLREVQLLLKTGDLQPVAQQQRVLQRHGHLRGERLQHDSSSDVCLGARELFAAARGRASRRASLSGSNGSPPRRCTNSSRSARRRPSIGSARRNTARPCSIQIEDLAQLPHRGVVNGSPAPAPRDQTFARERDHDTTSAAAAPHRSSCAPRH